jgi:CubicO group peptidase (beta-lactamase class C family)
MDHPAAAGRHWPDIDPREAGFDPDRLEKALRFARDNESQWPNSMYTHEGVFVGSAYVEDKPPYDQPLGPVFPRGSANGVIIRRGALVASWGNPDQVDMTFSIAKSYLAILAGIAVDRGLIPSIDEPVGNLVSDGGFDDPHNAPITWRHLLEQTSEWHGELFDRPDSVDWNRQVGPETDNRNKGGERSLQAPGEHYEYNDVRVNRLALSLLRVFKQALPDVLREAIMDPLGASGTWQWNGYDNSWVDVDDQRIQSVTGGGHWGGGIIISARDHARVGELIRNRGRMGGKQLLSESWVDAMLTPSAANKQYGLLWWLNTDRGLYPSAPASSVFALGGGQNLIWVDRPRELVVVARWVHKPVTDALLGAISQAIID